MLETESALCTADNERAIFLATEADAERQEIAELQDKIDDLDEFCANSIFFIERKESYLGKQVELSA